MTQQNGRSGSIAAVPTRTRRVMPWLVTLCTVVALTVPAEGSVEVRTATGIRAVIHAPADVAEYLDHAGGEVWFRHPQAGDLELDTTRFPWDDLVPVPADEVVAALEAMQGFQTDVVVDVFLLPGFPVGIWSSFARGGAIFLAPAFAATAPSTVHYVVTHEMGHILTVAAIDPQPARWAAYLALRGLEATALDPAAAHAERAREILAEDLRHLFGGPLATLSGTIENAGLPLPEAVPGLVALLVGFLREPGPATVVTAVARAFPNPCNPQTTIELVLPSGTPGDGSRAVLDIVDVRGRLVRRVQGGEVGGGTVRVTWAGDDAAGEPVSSGVYLYELRLGETVGRGRVSVVR